MNETLSGSVDSFCFFPFRFTFFSFKDRILLADFGIRVQTLTLSDQQPSTFMTPYFTGGRRLGATTAGGIETSFSTGGKWGHLFPLAPPEAFGRVSQDKQRRLELHTCKCQFGYAHQPQSLSKRIKSVIWSNRVLAVCLPNPLHQDCEEKSNRAVKLLVFSQLACWLAGRLETSLQTNL